MIIWKFFSIIFHPIFIPFLTIYLATNYIDCIDITFSFNNHIIYWGFITFTFILPICITSSLIFFKTRVFSFQTTSFIMKKKEERALPLCISFLFSILGILFFYKLSNIDSFVLSFYFSVSFFYLISFLISLRFKISLHMISIGSCVSTFLFIHVNFCDTALFLLGSFILSCILFFSRVFLRSHNNREAYIGFFLGIVFQYLFLFFYFNNFYNLNPSF